MSSVKKLKLDRKRKLVLISGLSATILATAFLGLVNTKGSKNKTLESYIQPSVISTEYNINNLSFFNKTFDPKNEKQLNEVLDNYKVIFDERDIKVNYEFLKYWILFDNHLFPDEVSKLSNFEYSKFINSLFELVGDIIVYNFHHIPNDFISLTGFYGKENPMDVYFVNLSEEYQFKIVNSYYYDSKQETINLIKEYFWFQKKILIEDQSVKINNQEVKFSSCLVPTKRKVLLNVDYLNEFLDCLGFLNNFISSVGYDEQRKERKYTEYPLLDIKEIIKGMSIDYNIGAYGGLYNDSYQSFQYLK